MHTIQNASVPDCRVVEVVFLFLQLTKYMSSVLLCCSGTPESILAQVAVMATGFFITCYWCITKLSKSLCRVIASCVPIFAWLTMMQRRCQLRSGGDLNWTSAWLEVASDMGYRFNRSNDRCGQRSRNTATPTSPPVPDSVCVYM